MIQELQPKQAKELIILTEAPPSSWRTGTIGIWSILRGYLIIDDYFTTFSFVRKKLRHQSKSMVVVDQINQIFSD